MLQIPILRNVKYILIVGNEYIFDKLIILKESFLVCCNAYVRWNLKYC